ncbi:MAG: RHS repeat-associated core domain-containing protein, partial [Ignavibacteriae bacterium]|nr:RHS repeat-associated core domain-containing protein [Ignavibacteriota bacterium]
VRSNFSYDKSNRLLKVERYNTKYFDLAGEYSYDPDGNFTSLTRSYNSDNFSYQYYSGTNRLKKVTGLSDQYTYDYNGNQTNDYLAGNTGISYDHRNLITEITRSNNTTDPPTTIKIRYKYDEAGNRTRKSIYQTQDENPSPITNDDNPTGWSITKDEYYSRDASGKEIAVYQSYALDYWNVWGSGNEGRIKPTGMKYFYLKDHLGSIRAVINQNNVLVEAQDYDPWGHIARSWDSTSTDYKFTGKERDQESNYDYFGARYYDARIGRWGGIEPLLEKYFSYSPYQYGLLNPMRLVDANGCDVYLYGDEAKNVLSNLNSYTSLKIDYNDKTGKLSVATFNSDNLNKADQLLYDAITNSDFKVNIYCIDNTRLNGDPAPWMVGAFIGGGRQLISNKDVEYLADIGIEAAGKTIMHEVLEAFLGISEKMDYTEAHNKTSKILNQNDEYSFGPLSKRSNDVSFIDSKYVDMGIFWKNKTYKLFKFDNFKNKVNERYDAPQKNN